MIPPVSLLPAGIGFNCTDEELFTAFERLVTGSPLPSNVIDGINPYMHKPNDLPGGIWYLISSNEKRSTEYGFWRTKGEACEVFANSAIIGWRATLQYYEGQVPQERETDWLMQCFSITLKKLCEQSKAKEASVLCRVFLGGEESPDQNVQQKTALTDFDNTKLNFSGEELNGSSNRSIGSTSEPKVSEDDNAGTLAVTERPADHHVEIPQDPDYISRGDYLELMDLDIPSSPSSSENSSCMTFSSDECFDSLAFLQDLEPEIDQVLDQRNTGYRFNISAPHTTDEVIMLPANPGSLHHVRTNPATEEVIKTGFPAPTSIAEGGNPENGKHPARTQKRERQGEGSSSGSYNSSTPTPPSSSHGGQKKGSGSRMKRLKKYLCFLQF